MAKAKDTVPIKILLDVAVIVHVPRGTNIDAITEHVRGNAATGLREGLNDRNEEAFKVERIDTKHVGTVLAQDSDLPQAVEA